MESSQKLVIVPNTHKIFMNLQYIFINCLQLTFVNFHHPFVFSLLSYFFLFSTPFYFRLLFIFNSLRHSLLIKVTTTKIVRRRLRHHQNANQIISYIKRLKYGSRWETSEPVSKKMVCWLQGIRMWKSNRYWRLNSVWKCK